MDLKTVSFLLIAVASWAGCDQSADQLATTANAPSPESVAVTDSIDVGESTDSSKAMCQIVPIGDSEVEGLINFVQYGKTVKIVGEITGLEPGQHGFHIHESGDLSDTQTGKSTGGHYNPTDEPHGRMSDAKRHVGDLGNIVANQEGVAIIEKKDDIISLSGEHSIIGRAIVVHADADQFTQPTGDAGARVAFGKIETH